MIIYKIDKLPLKPEHCIVQSHGNIDTYKVTTGLPRTRTPEDFRDARLPINEENHGVELTDLIGTTNLFLIIRNTVYEALLAQLELAPIEAYKFRLLTARGRVHSDDYLIVNPLGTHDCLSREHSELSIDEEDGEILMVHKPALEQQRVPELDMFRITKDPTEQFVTQRFVDVVRSAGYTNFNFVEVPLV